jgi:AcrR family transcriptional regulator
LAETTTTSDSSAKSGRGKRNPARTREAILQAALAEFAAHGLGGGRVDEIARRSRMNKRMIYHYFGSKEGLYLAALERTYAELRSAEQALHLEHVDPVTAMRRLVRMSFRFFEEHPHFISMLNTENLHDARILQTSPHIREMHSPLVAMIEDILARGRKAGVMRGDVDPVQLYVSIASLGYFYFSNNATLSTVFGRDLRSAEAMDQREAHVVEMVLAFLEVPSAQRGGDPAGA